MSKILPSEALRLYNKSKESCLEAFLKEGEDSIYGNPILWCEFTGLDGKRWGSYQTMSTAKLKDRDYDIIFVNDKPGIFFKDMIYNNRTFAHESIHNKRN